MRANIMNERDLARIAEYEDEEAIHAEDFELVDLLSDFAPDAKKFKDKYSEYYDDIKFKERDWW